MSLSVSPVNRKLSFVILLVSVFIAIFFGLVAVTANPILVSFAVALFVGTVLIARPTWIIWLVLFLGLLVTGNLPLYFETLGTKSAWGVSLLCFLLMLLTFIKTAIQPDSLKNTPAFVWVAFAFMVYALLNSLIQWNSAYEYFSGFKRYFHMWGIIFALSWLAFDERDIQRWRKFILIVALVQLPFVIYQVLVFVPLRESFNIPGLASIDVVAGTFGATLMGGGANAEMATFLVIVLAFLLSRLREKLITLRTFFLIAPFILVPLFMGETKVIMVLFPLMLLVLYRWELVHRPHYGLIIVFMGVLFAIALGNAYIGFTKSENFDEMLDDTMSYNVYERGYGGNYLNRTTVLTFWIERQGFHNPVSFMFGNGLGSSHEQTGGHVARYYFGYGIGLTATSTLLWDLGVLGFGLFITILVLAWRSADRLRLESNLQVVRADAAAIQTTLVLFGFYLFYRMAILETLSFQMVFTLLLGYLAWMYRRTFSCNNS